MSGGGLLGLILLSMAWLFFLGGLAANYAVLKKSLSVKSDERAASSLGFVPGVVGSLSVFFTIPALATHGVEVPWPWLWILLPLFLDPYCLGALAVMVYLRWMRPSG